MLRSATVPAYRLGPARAAITTNIIRPSALLPISAFHPTPPPVSRPVLSSPAAVPSTVPRARACPVAVSARRVWSIPETLPPSLPFWSRLLTAVPAPAPAWVDIRRYLPSTCPWHCGPISSCCLRLVLGFRHFTTEGDLISSQSSRSFEQGSTTTSSTSPGLGFRPRAG